MVKGNEREKALVVFDYIYFAMRGKYFLEHAGFKTKEVAPPPEYRTGCDMALEIDAEDVDEVERILEKNDVLFMDILFLPKGAQLVPVYLTQLIKVTDLVGYTMVRCGNMKITYRKGIGTIVNVSGGGWPDIPMLGSSIMDTVIGEGPTPKELGKTLCAYTLEHAYQKALDLFRSERSQT